MSADIVSAAKLLMIAIKNGDIIVFPSEKKTPDYVQILEDAINREDIKVRLSKILKDAGM